MKTIVFRWEVEYDLDEIASGILEHAPDLTPEEALEEAVQLANDYAYEDVTSRRHVSCEIVEE